MHALLPPQPPTTSTPTRMPTTLHDPTAPASTQLLQPVHQQHTQSNNPFAILEDNAQDDNNDSIADNITVQANNRTVKRPQQEIQLINVL